MTKAELADKIEWEGGIVEAIRYGIAADDVPEDIRDLWATAVQAVATLDKLEEYFSEIL